ncbi:MAG: P-II family nitrogen regulator [Phycisphaerales bacterium]|nr:P-II family nitrogen regulator [Phycisphaerales bacterium]
MKLLIAVIRPERLDAVQAALRAVLDEGDNFRLTIDPVEGHGRQQGQVEYFRGQPVQQRMVQRVQLTIGLNDAYVEPAIQAILSSARTEPNGQVGDGKIFVVPLEECVRIRTGERGGSAI